MLQKFYTSSKSAIAAMLMVTILTISFSQNVRADACSDARSEAEREVSPILWFGAGCLFNLLGVAGAYLIKPSPPATMLVGKSSEYVAQYTDCYHDFGTSVQTRNAWYGCGANAVVYILWVFVIASSAGAWYRI